jgi:hypothetical protein
MGQIEDAAEKHQHVICCPRGIAVAAHVADQFGDVFVGDLVERQTPERRQKVMAKVHFVDVPTSLVRLGVGQIPITGKLDERRDAQQFLTVGLRVGTKQSASGGCSIKATGLVKRQRVMATARPADRCITSCAGSLNGGSSIIVQSAARAIEVVGTTH